LQLGLGFAVWSVTSQVVSLGVAAYPGGFGLKYVLWRTNETLVYNPHSLVIPFRGELDGIVVVCLWVPCSIRFLGLTAQTIFAEGVFFFVHL
jgi:hypothetical protein